MSSKNKLFLFALVFPLTFFIGVIVSLTISLRVDEHVQLDWLIVFAVAIVADVLITWWHIRDEKNRKGAS